MKKIKRILQSKSIKVIFMIFIGFHLVYATVASLGNVSVNMHTLYLESTGIMLFIYSWIPLLYLLFGVISGFICLVYGMQKIYENLSGSTKCGDPAADQNTTSSGE